MYPGYYDLGKGHKYYSKFSGKETSYLRIIEVWVPKGSMSLKFDIGHLRPNPANKNARRFEFCCYKCA